MRDVLAVAVRAGDRRGDDARGAQAHIPRRPQHAGDGVGPQIAGSVTRPPLTAVRPTSNCGLISSTRSASGVATARAAGRTCVERDERQVAGDDRRAAHPRRSRRRATRAVMYRTLKPSTGMTSRVGRDGCGELPMTDIDRDHRSRAALAQHLRESARSRRPCRARRGRRPSTPKASRPAMSLCAARLT